MNGKNAHGFSARGVFLVISCVFVRVGTIAAIQFIPIAERIRQFRKERTAKMDEKDVCDRICLFYCLDQRKSVLFCEIVVFGLFNKND